MTNVTIGIDLGDKNHEVCVLDNAGEVIERFMVGNTKIQIQKAFAKYAGALVAMETGTHSPWVSRTLIALGCRVLVANARKVRAIWARSQKTDVKDAEMLARIARLDPKLLYPIHHRSKKAQLDLEQVKARDLLVRLRTDLINHVRGAVKSRAIGPHLGLTPRKDQSGSSDKPLRISKEGNVYLRRLLVSCSQFILGPFGQDSDLRRYGIRLIARGGGSAKRKAVVAVARKLGILLHHLWSTGEVYQPLHNAKSAA
jgi:transposase